MAITKSAKKRIKSSEKKRVFNMRRSRAMKDIIKKFTKSVEAGETKAASEMMPQVHKAIDKASKGGVIKANTASRKKSRLAKRLKSADTK